MKLFLPHFIREVKKIAWISSKLYYLSTVVQVHGERAKKTRRSTINKIINFCILYFFALKKITVSWWFFFFSLLQCAAIFQGRHRVKCACTLSIFIDMSSRCRTYIAASFFIPRLHSLQLLACSPTTKYPLQV